MQGTHTDSHSPPPYSAHSHNSVRRPVTIHALALVLVFDFDFDLFLAATIIIAKPALPFLGSGVQTHIYINCRRTIYELWIHSTGKAKALPLDKKAGR